MSKLSDVVKNDVGKKTVYDKLAAKVNNPVVTQSPGDVLCRFPKRSNVRDLQGTKKKLMIWWKKCFLDAIVFILHIYFLHIVFYQENKYSEVVYGNVHRKSTGTSLGDQMMGRSGDVSGMSVIHVFKIQLRNILNLLWQVTQDFMVNCGSKIFNEQYSNLNSKN